MLMLVYDLLMYIPLTELAKNTKKNNSVLSVRSVRYKNQSFKDTLCRKLKLSQRNTAPAAFRAKRHQQSPYHLRTNVAELRVPCEACKAK